MRRSAYLPSGTGSSRPRRPTQAFASGSSEESESPVSRETCRTHGRCRTRHLQRRVRRDGVRALQPRRRSSGGTRPRTSPCSTRTSAGSTRSSCSRTKPTVTSPIEDLQSTNGTKVERQAHSRPRPRPRRRDPDRAHRVSLRGALKPPLASTGRLHGAPEAKVPRCRPMPRSAVPSGDRRRSPRLTMHAHREPCPRRAPEDSMTDRCARTRRDPVRLARRLTLGLLGLFAVACATPTPTPAPERSRAAAYRAGPPDQLTIQILPDPAINSRTWSSGPDGKITVGLIGDVQAGGRTMEEIAREIEQRVGRFKRGAQATVALVDQCRRAPRSPCSVKCGARARLALDASPCASRKRSRCRSRDRPSTPTSIAITVVRNVGKEVRVIRVDVGAIRGGDLSTNVMLHGGDIVYVPPSGAGAKIGYGMQALLFPLQPLLGHRSGRRRQPDHGRLLEPGRPCEGLPPPPRCASRARRARFTACRVRFRPSGRGGAFAAPSGDPRSARPRRGRR